jgi:hypothetical protein
VFCKHPRERTLDNVAKFENHTGENRGVMTLAPQWYEKGR